MQLAKDRVLLRKRQTRFANIQRIWTRLHGLAHQGLVSNSEKEEQGGRADSSDSKAQSFPSDKDVSPDVVPSTNKDNSSASVGSTNLDTSTAKDFTDVDERPILKQAEPSEQVSDMVENQGGDGYGTFYVSAH